MPPSPTVKRSCRPPLATAAATRPAKATQRADRKIDAGGQDDEGHADREQAGDRDLPHDVEQVDSREEARLHESEQDHQGDKEQQRRESGDKAEKVDSLVLRRCQLRLAHDNSAAQAADAGHAALMQPSSSPSGFSCVASVRAISPVTRPSRIVTMRSEIARISGSSDEMTMTAMPVLRHFDEQIVHLDLRSRYRCRGSARRR